MLILNYFLTKVNFCDIIIIEIRNYAKLFIEKIRKRGDVKQ
jgi:hypothetical protein